MASFICGLVWGCILALYIMAWDFAIAQEFQVRRKIKELERRK